MSALFLEQTSCTVTAQVGWGDQRSRNDNVVVRGGDQFLDLVKNTYRVLLTRGMKGCFVHFLDKETEQFFRSRIEIVGEPPDRDTRTAATPRLLPDRQMEML